jgi:basic membrane protein A
MRSTLSFVVLSLCLSSCKKDAPAPSASTAPTDANRAAEKRSLAVGLVTDVGGRGDHSFNDSALRGLEAWAANVKFQSGKYVPLSLEERASLIPETLRSDILPLDVRPLVVQSKAQEDYQPNLQLLVDQGAGLIVGTGFLLENAVEAVAKANPQAKFVLIDSPVLDPSGAVISLPNVRTIVFREEEGSFLAGALAGLVAKGKVGFVGGMEIPLIKKFEAGYRAGVKATAPEASVLVQYTGSFDNVSAGKQATVDLIGKGAQVIFHAAGSDGNGVIQAVKEAHAAGKPVYAIGVDSDQSHLAPDAVVSSMLKRVDLAVWQASSDLVRGAFSTGDVVMGLKTGGVELAPLMLTLPDRERIAKTLEVLKEKVVAGEIRVPSKVADVGKSE